MIVHYMILFVYGMIQSKLRLYQYLLLEIRKAITSCKHHLYIVFSFKYYSVFCLEYFI
jgi:hypothetical protein